MSYLSLRGHFLVTSNANRLATIHDFFVKLWQPADIFASLGRFMDSGTCPGFT